MQGPTTPTTQRNKSSIVFADRGFFSFTTAMSSEATAGKSAPTKKRADMGRGRGVQNAFAGLPVGSFLAVACAPLIDRSTGPKSRVTVLDDPDKRNLSAYDYKYGSTKQLQKHATTVRKTHTSITRLSPNPPPPPFKKQNAPVGTILSLPRFPHKQRA